jgi:hypothetical protein
MPVHSRSTHVALRLRLEADQQSDGSGAGMTGLFRTGVFLSALALGTATCAYAQDAPPADSAVQEVNDAKALEQLLLIVEGQAKVVKNQTDQIQKQVDQIDKLDEQLAALQLQLEAMTGNKNMSTLSGASAADSPLKAAESLSALADSALNGGGAGGRVDEIIAELKTKFDFKNLDEMISSKDKRFAMRARIIGIGLASAATAEDQYIRSNEAMARLATYIGEIDKTPDLKASVDLNTRVLTEVLQSINENFRTEATVASINSSFALEVMSEMYGDPHKFDSHYAD